MVDKTTANRVISSPFPRRVVCFVWLAYLSMGGHIAALMSRPVWYAVSLTQPYFPKIDLKRLSLLHSEVKHWGAATKDVCQAM